MRKSQIPTKLEANLSSMSRVCDYRFQPQGQNWENVLTQNTFFDKTRVLTPKTLEFDNSYRSTHERLRLEAAP